MTAHPNAGFSTFPIVAFHPGMGEAGKVVVIYYRADAGRVITFDPSTQSFDAERPSPYRDEWGVPGNCCFVTAANKILFGSAGGKEAYTIDADGTIAPIAAAPANFGTQEDDASHCLLVPHPTLGAAFMFSSNGNVYKYAFSSNSWSLVGQMPSGVCDTLYAKDKVSRSFAVAVPLTGHLITTSSPLSDTATNRPFSTCTGRDDTHIREHRSGSHAPRERLIAPKCACSCCPTSYSAGPLAMA